MHSVAYILGGDETASATALKLHRCGFRVVLFANPIENLLRYPLCLGDTLFQGKKVLENTEASLLQESDLSAMTAVSPSERRRQALHYLFQDRKIAVLPLREFEDTLALQQPDVIIHFYLKTQAPVIIDHARLVIGSYPAHVPGIDCHIAVETRLSYFLGQYYTPNCKIPDVLSEGQQAFFSDPFAHCKSPLGGVWLALKNIGDPVSYNEAIGRVDAIEIRSPYNGQIWGMTHSGKLIDPQTRIALIFQGKPTSACWSLGFRERAIAGAVLEATLKFFNL